MIAFFHLSLQIKCGGYFIEKNKEEFKLLNSGLSGDQWESASTSNQRKSTCLNDRHPK